MSKKKFDPSEVGLPSATPSTSDLSDAARDGVSYLDNLFSPRKETVIDLRQITSMQGDPLPVHNPSSPASDFDLPLDKHFLESCSDSEPNVSPEGSPSCYDIDSPFWSEEGGSKKEREKSELLKKASQNLGISSGILNSIEARSFDGSVSLKDASNFLCSLEKSADVISRNLSRPLDFSHEDFLAVSAFQGAARSANLSLDSYEEKVDKTLASAEKMVSFDQGLRDSSRYSCSPESKELENLHAQIRMVSEQLSSLKKTASDLSKLSLSDPSLLDTISKMTDYLAGVSEVLSGKKSDDFEVSGSSFAAFGKLYDKKVVSLYKKEISILADTSRVIEDAFVLAGKVSTANFFAAHIKGVYLNWIQGAGNLELAKKSLLDLALENKSRDKNLISSVNIARDNGVHCLVDLFDLTERDFMFFQGIGEAKARSFWAFVESLGFPVFHTYKKVPQRSAFWKAPHFSYWGLESFSELDLPLKTSRLGAKILSSFGGFYRSSYPHYQTALGISGYEEYSVRLNDEFSFDSSNSSVPRLVRICEPTKKKES